MEPIAATPETGSQSGLEIELTDGSTIELTHVFKHGADTVLYATTNPSLVVKLYDLACDKPGEISYSPFTGFNLELAHFEDVLAIEELRPCVPAYYGASIDYERRIAFIVMEFIEGENLREWSERMRDSDAFEAWSPAFRRAAYESLFVIELFHRNGMLLVDFKPENALRLPDGTIRFVDLGAFFTYRYRGKTEDYAYSATPDHAEVLIDACNLETGNSLTEASDIFSAGVGLFEMAVGTSRLKIEQQTADDILSHKELFLFRDTQIRDVWKAYPHLKSLLPTVETQLQERELLFADFWHVLKGYLAERVQGWSAMTDEQHDQIVLTTGTTFISDQMPPALQWLGGPVAQATALRSLRLKRVAELRLLLNDPVAPEVSAAAIANNQLLSSLTATGHSAAFVNELNSWDMECSEERRVWAISASEACRHLPDGGGFTFLRLARTENGACYYEVCADLDADDAGSGKLTAATLRADRRAWLL